MDALVLWSGWIACALLVLGWWLARRSGHAGGLGVSRALEAQIQEHLDGYAGEAVPPLVREAARRRPAELIALLAESVPPRGEAAHARAARMVDTLGLDDRLMRQLRSRRTRARLAAAMLVGCFRQARYQAELLALLDDRDAAVAAAAARGLLRQVEDLPTVDGLRCLALLQRRRPLAVAAAADELDEAGLWRLLTLADQLPSAAAALMQCLAHRVMPIAPEVLADGLVHADPAARRWACAACATHGARELLDELRRLAEHDPAAAVRLAAVDALGELTDPANLEVLDRIRAHRGEAAQRHAERALAAHGPEGWQRLRQEA